ncbi:MAG: hypothetical protein AAGK00_11065 [Pseudomonadota bacterium]
MFDFVDNSVFVSVLQGFSLLVLIATVAALGFAAHDLTRQKRRGAGERNWRFLFSCWADSVLIMVLYAAVNLTWLFERLSSFSGYLPGRAGFVALTIEAVLYVVILIVAVRLLLRIRRFLEHA